MGPPRGVCLQRSVGVALRVRRRTDRLLRGGDVVAPAYDGVIGAQPATVVSTNGNRLVSTSRRVGLPVAVVAPTGKRVIGRDCARERVRTAPLNPVPGSCGIAGIRPIPAIARQVWDVVGFGVG